MAYKAGNSQSWPSPLRGIVVAHESRQVQRIECPGGYWFNMVGTHAALLHDGRKAPPGTIVTVKKVPDHRFGNRGGQEYRWYASTEKKEAP